MKPTKVHCSAPPPDWIAGRAIVELLHGGRYELHDGDTFVQSLCGRAAERIGRSFPFKEGGDVIDVVAFACLPRQIQCASCLRLYDISRQHGRHIPFGQKSATDEQIIAVECFLFSVAEVFGR